MASTHPSVVVGHSDEIIATGPSVGVDEELRHIQVSAGNKSHSMLEVKPQKLENLAGNMMSVSRISHRFYVLIHLLCGGSSLMIHCSLHLFPMQPSPSA